jgi:hypothetical protein
MPRTPIVATVALIAAVGLVAGCGTTSGSAPHASSLQAAPAAHQPGTPRAELGFAIAALSKRSALTTTVGLAATARELAAAASTLGHPLTPAQAKALSGLRLRVETVAPAGTTIAGLRGHRSAGSRALDLTSHGTPYLQVVRTHGTYYLRGHVEAALLLTGHRDLWRTLLAHRASLPRFVRAFVHGRWISLPAATAQLIVTALRQRLSLPSEQQIHTLIAGVRAALARDVTVTRAGPTGTTDHLLLTADAATLSRDLYAVVRRALPGLGRHLDAQHHATPTGTLTVRATVMRGVLTDLRTDLAQLDPALTTRLPFSIRFRGSGPPITAPRHSTPVDLTGLIGLAGLFSHQGASG